jgi:hypothetical protein
MRSRWGAAAMAMSLLGGCASDRVTPAEAPLEAAVDEEVTEHEVRFGRRLLAGRWDLAEGGTDVIPPRAFWIEERGQRRPAPDALDGWLTASGALFVTLERELVDADGAVIATDVEVDVCVSAEGDRIAFSQENGEGLSRVMLYALGADTPPRVATEAFDDALLPFFLADGTLVLAAAHQGEILGLFHVDPESGTTRRLTNDGLLIGAGSDPRFVPLPLGARHMRELDGRIVYFDGDAEQTVSLAPALAPAPTPGLGAVGSTGNEVSP